MRTLMYLTALTTACLLMACGGKDEEEEKTYALSGTVTGLKAPSMRIRYWSGVGTSNASEDEVVVTGDGPFTFSRRIPEGRGYVMVLDPPENPLQSCLATPLSETGITSDRHVQITCKDAYRIRGTLTGLRGDHVSFFNQVGRPTSLDLSGDGPFEFPTRFVADEEYDIVVNRQPRDPEQTCIVIKGSGRVVDQDVDDIVVDCSDPSEAEAWRAWRMTRQRPDAPEEVISESPGYPNLVQDSEGLHTADFGRMSLDYDDDQNDKIAHGEVFSNRSGSTYWVSAQAPSQEFADGNSASSTVYRQMQSYRKLEDSASVELDITEILLEAYNDREEHCEDAFDIDAYGPLERMRICTLVEPVQARFIYEVSIIKGNAASPANLNVLLQHYALTGRLSGRVAQWDHGVYWLAQDSSYNSVSVFGTSGGTDHFTYSGDLTGDQTHRHVKLELSRTLTIAPDLSKVGVGEEFTLRVDLEVFTSTSHGESYASAFFRDPARVFGGRLRTSGVESTNQPFVGTPAPGASPAPTCPAGADPTSGGVLGFSEGSYFAHEQNGRTQPILVTRTGASAGAVEVTVTSSSSSATAGADYEPITQRVHFADGDTTPRLLEIPILPDDEIEQDEAITLQLSPPAGCAELGTLSSAQVIIIDDERQPDVVAPNTFTVGGTVSGLTGSGLVISNSNLLHDRLSPGNGAFTFPSPLVNGADYDVRVEVQPTNPRQICTVMNGKGTIADASVTDVAIDCVDAPVDGSLDTSFGNGGFAVGLPAGGADAMAIAPDDSIVVINDRLRVARYDRDGRIDTAFGTAGEVTLSFSGQSTDELQGVAVQPDGKIIVVGFSRSSFNADDDFAVARLNTDGSLDTTFGAGGKVLTDFGHFDRAWFALVQNDGKIIVGGFAGTANGGTDFALVRYGADGVPDPGFGTAGKATADLSLTDGAMAGALRSDGAIVIAGGAGDSGTSFTDSALARFLPNGTLDTTFDSDGMRRYGLAPAGRTDTASTVLLQPDGKIIMAGDVNVTAFNGTRFGVARFNEDGSPDASFGVDGLSIVEFTTDADFPGGAALQADGRIVVAGWAGSFGPNPDFAVARLNADGSLDPDFATGGKLRVDFFGDVDGATGMGLQRDGRIVAAGYTENGSTSSTGIIRVVP